MSISRKDFLKNAAYGVAATALVASSLDVLGAKVPKPKKDAPTLKLSFQEGIAPGETLAERFDFMEKHGIVGFEPNGAGLPQRVNEIEQLLRGRNIKLSAVCAGFNGFILSEDEAVRNECKKTLYEIMAAAGQLGATGVIMVPAFHWNKNSMPHTAQTREFLVSQLAEMGEVALKNNTTLILEPLNRKEAHYLRQVGDAAMLCKDSNSSGVKCMGDFWHMTPEESCDYAAFISSAKYLQHVHIASRKRRVMPGEDGLADNYLAGFRALKELNYPHYVSFECGVAGNKEAAAIAAIELLRSQWQEA